MLNMNSKLDLHKSLESLVYVYIIFHMSRALPVVDAAVAGAVVCAVVPSGVVVSAAIKQKDQI